MMRKNAPPKNEQEFWERKAEVAKRALKNTISSLGRNVSGASRLSTWTERYPLQTTGVALLAGFAVAGPFAHPLSRDQESATASTPKETVPSMQIWATLIATGADIVKDVLTPLLQEWVMPKGKDRGPGTRD